MAETQGGGTGPSGKKFFDRAVEVAGTGNWDFAIEMYIEGIQREPGNIEQGHQPLREVALKRTATGGKPAGMMDAFKHRGGKGPEALANAEYLLAKEPGSAVHLVATLKAAKHLKLQEVSNWVARILLEVQRQSKPSKAMLLLLIETFQQCEEYASAIGACEMALKLTPEDVQLSEKLQELSAKYTIKKGQYDKEGDFSRAVKDMDKQKELSQKDSLVQTKGFLEQQIDTARQGYLETPNEQGKINGFVDALLKTKDSGNENEAIDVLDKAHRETGAYQFKMRIGDIRIRQMAARYRNLLENGDKKGALDQARMQLAFELEEYAERAANYPTDLGIKFELGKRQLLVRKYDEAIGSLQQAQRDPRRHLAALNYLGQAFAKKQWYPEAAETYERALSTDVPEERKKDLLYNLGDVYEKMENLSKCQDLFSDLAQLDFNYRDVRDRLDRVRKKIGEQKSSGDS